MKNNRTLRSLFKMTWVEAKLFLREPVGAFFTLIFPLMYLVLFGSISGNQPADIFSGHRTIDAAIPSLTAMVIGLVGLIAISITIATYREKGILRRLRTTPVSPLVILVAQVIVVFVMTALGMLLLIAVGMIFYQARFEGNVLSLLAGFVLSSLSFFSLGFILSGILPSARFATILGNVLIYPMVFLSGSFFPLEVFPKAIQKVAAFNPLTYVVNLLRGLWFGEPWSAHLLDVGVLVGMLVVGIVISAKTFRWE